MILCCHNFCLSVLVPDKTVKSTNCVAKNSVTEPLLGCTGGSSNVMSSSNKSFLLLLLMFHSMNHQY